MESGFVLVRIKCFYLATSLFEPLQELSTCLLGSINPEVASDSSSKRSSGLTRRSYLIDFGFHLESSKVVLCTHDLSDFAAGLSFVLGFEVGDCGWADFRSTTWSDC